MQASARNQFTGKVSKINQGVVTDEVHLHTSTGVELVATITHGSSKNLNLQPGSQVTALVKAPSVLIVTNAEGMKFSARNQLAGKVTAVKKGSVNSEVQIESHGLKVVAIVTNDSAESMDLKEGTIATALIKASQIILAVHA